MFPIAIITNVWSAITGIVKNNKITTYAIIAALLFGFLSLKQCQSNREWKKRLAVAEQNIKAANDTIRYERTRNGDTLAVKLAFLTDKVSHLEDLNKDLYDEVKTIKGNVSTIIKSDVKLVHDSFPVVVKAELRDSTLTNTFDYSKTFSPGNFRTFNGWTKYNLRNGETSGQVNTDEIGIRFKTGIRNLDKDKPEIFLESSYPGFKVTALDGAVLDPTLFSKKPKTKLITTGINIGWLPVTYDLRTKRWDFNVRRVGVTAGLNINILKLLKPNK